MKYAEFRKKKALDLKKSLDCKKVIEVEHYNEQIGVLVSNTEYEYLKRAKEIKENSGD